MHNELKALFCRTENLNNFVYIFRLAKALTDNWNFDVFVKRYIFHIYSF